MTTTPAVPAVLEAEVVVRLGSLHLEMSLAVAAGETVVVLGPNGAGKTTFIRALAGLEAVVSGRVSIDGEIVEDVSSGLTVPPEQRPIGVVFQDALLFPHLSALDNVAFGLRCRGVGRAEARRRAGGWLADLGLAGQAQARPADLSGGQAQRVALARAMAVEPRLYLLDEPLSALDASTRLATRQYLRRCLDGHPGATVVVTHDPADASVLADRLVILEEGRVVQSGSPAELRADPVSNYVADLFSDRTG